MKNQRGDTLIGFMAAALITSIVLASAVTSLLSFSKNSENNKLISETNDRARTVIDLMSYELRFMGAGVPFQQTNFLMSNGMLGSAPFPILTTSTNTAITFRVNSRGRVGHLTGSFNPAIQNSFMILSNTGISAGDTVYLSDLAAGGSNGLQGTVQSAVGNMVTLSAGSVYAPGATFAAGSTVQPVQTITYNSAAGGITRTQGATVSTLAAGSSFTAQYYDTAGVVMVLPLTAATIGSNLASISLTVTVPSSRTLSTGALYTASLTTRIALRELNVYR